MKNLTVTQIQGIEAAQLFDEFEQLKELIRCGLSGDAITPDDLPWLGKEEAAMVLRCSAGYIDTLVQRAELQPHYPFTKRPATVRFRTEDVLKLRAAGKTGRR